MKPAMVQRLSFVLRTAARDLRSHPSRLALYAVSISLGVAAVVAVAVLRARLESALQAQSKVLLGADVVVSSRRPFPPEAQALLDALPAVRVGEMSFRTMLHMPSREASRMVQVRALEDGFPLYGELETQPPGVRFPQRGEVVVESSVLQQFGVAPGDTVQLGEARFRVAAAAVNIPGESPAEALIAPRVLMSRADLEGTGLIQPGAIFGYRLHLRLEGEGTPDQVRQMLQPYRLDVQTVESRLRSTLQAMDGVARYLGLVGLAALLLGCLGVASAMHLYARERLPDAALLRCLGASRLEAAGVFLVQAAALAGSAAVVGAGLGVLLTFPLRALVRDLLPVDVALGPDVAMVARAAGLAFCCALAFALWPLLRLRRAAPLCVLRQGDAAPSLWRDPAALIGAVLLGLTLVLLAARPLGSWLFGAAFAAGFALVLLALAGLAMALRACARRWVGRLRGAPWPLRHSVAHLYRPQNQTLLLVMVLGAGITLLALLQGAQYALRAQLQVPDARQPNLVLIDVQTDQREAAREVLQASSLPLLNEAAIVPMRMDAVAGRRVQDLLVDPARTIPDWSLKREYRSTYRADLVATEQQSAGVWPPASVDPARPIPVSVEQGLMETLQLRLGDELVFDVQGLPMTTRVAATRTVDWRSMQPNFFVVFPPGVLESAPQTLALFTRADTAGSADLQRRLADRLPNVTALDVAFILETVNTLVARLNATVQFLALFCAGAGLLVLAGAVRAGRAVRLPELATLRTLGARRGELRSLLLVEYALLGVLSAAAGWTLALPATWALCRWGLEVPYRFDAVGPAVSTLLAALATVGTGWLNSRGLLTKPPRTVNPGEG